MQMGPCGPAAAAAQTNPLTAGDVVPLSYFDLGKMHVQGEETLPMVEHDAITLEE
jgi:hypothetical protein